MTEPSFDLKKITFVQMVLIGKMNWQLIQEITYFVGELYNPKIIETRQFKNFDQNEFRRDLMLIPWESIEHHCNDLDTAWLIWKEIFLSVCNHHAPVRRKRMQAR